jgi:hypothetical protein
MKIITTTWIVSLLCLFSAKAEPMSDKEKIEFIKYYRESVKLSEEFPDKLEVKAIFVDLDGDGNDEVFATSYGSFYETGWMWAAFRRDQVKWVPIKGYDKDSKLVTSGSGVYARPGEMFRVTKNNGSSEFVVLAEHYDKLAPEGKGPLNKSRFYLDKDGVFQEESIKDLERYLAYRASGEQWPEGTLIKKLEALKVEIFKN